MTLPTELRAIVEALRNAGVTGEMIAATLTDVAHNRAKRPSGIFYSQRLHLHHAAGILADGTGQCDLRHPGLCCGSCLVSLLPLNVRAVGPYQSLSVQLVLAGHIHSRLASTSAPRTAGSQHGLS